MDEQAGGTVEIALFEQGLDRLGVAAGRREPGHSLPPEAGRRRTARQRLPPTERLEHLPAALHTLPSREMGHARHGGGGVAIPPHGQLLQGGCSGCGRLPVAGKPGMPPGRRIAVEDCTGHADEILHPRIGQALTAWLVERKLAGQPEDVPGIDGGAAAHSPKQERDGLVELLHRRRPVATLPERLAGGNAAAGDPGEQPGRGRRHLGRQFLGGRPAAQPSQDRCQRDIFHLSSPTAGQGGVDVPPNTPKRLPQRRGLRLQTPGMRRRQPTDQPAIEGIAVAGDPRQQIPQRQCGLGGTRSVAAQPRGHQHHPGQHGRRLEPKFGLEPGLASRR